MRKGGEKELFLSVRINYVGLMDVLEHPALFALWLVIWYGGLSFFVRMLWEQIKSGEAGSSGKSLSRSAQPKTYWFTVAYELIVILFMATMPFLIVVSHYSAK